MLYQDTVWVVLVFLLADLPWKALGAEQQQQAPVTINTYGCSNAENLEKRLSALESMMLEYKQMVNVLQDAPNKEEVPIRDCSDVYLSGKRSSGVYKIRPEGIPAFPAYCRFDHEGQWTVIQRRIDGYVDFERNWAEYKKGFGVLNREMWLGLDKIHAITKQRQYQLRIDLTDWNDETLIATYSYFQIGDEESGYRLQYGKYEGTAGDSLDEYHKNKKFSTFDRDNDNKASEHCAELHRAGWWYNECDLANLNGKYHNTPQLNAQVDSGIEWDKWKSRYSFKKVIIRIKPTFNN